MDINCSRLELLGFDKTAESETQVAFIQWMSTPHLIVCGRVLKRNSVKTLPLV
jgi:hypothetical protein